MGESQTLRAGRMRLSVRRSSAIVVVAAILIVGFPLRRRSESFALRAAELSKEQARNYEDLDSIVAELGRINTRLYQLTYSSYEDRKSEIEATKFDSLRARERYSAVVARIKWVDAMLRKYELAAARPWLSIDPDPKPPPRPQRTSRFW